MRRGNRCGRCATTDPVVCFVMCTLPRRSSLRLIATPGLSGLMRRLRTLSAGVARRPVPLGFPLRHTLYLVQNYSTGTKYSGHSDEVKTDNLRERY